MTISIPAALQRCDPFARAAIVASLTPQAVRLLNPHFPEWAHGGQLEPPACAGAGPGDWRTWVLMAGRGFGKTRAGAEWVMACVRGERPVSPLTAATRQRAAKSRSSPHGGEGSHYPHPPKPLAWAPPSPWKGEAFKVRIALVAALYRPGPWTIRASLGRGFHAPTPFVEEVEAAGLSRLEPLSGLEAETAQTASIDVGYARGPLEASVTLFASNIDKATRLQTIAPDRVRLINVDGETRIRGAELLLRYRWDAFSITGSYVHVDATEPAETGPGRRPVPLTPRHTAGAVAMWEQHGKGRIGIEAYYTGRQFLDDNPYRSQSEPYLHLGVLGEIVLGKVSLFANAENILGVRQTRYDPLLLPQRRPGGQWTVDVWAPTEGFILNGGLRLRFGGH